MGRKAVAASGGHPTYADMIREAIVTLKERGGSSLVAIKKFVGQKYKLPGGWEKKLSIYIKKMTVDEKLVKVKGSWKLGEGMKKKKVVEKIVKKAAVQKGVQKKKVAGKEKGSAGGRSGAKKATATAAVKAKGAKKVAAKAAEKVKKVVRGSSAKVVKKPKMGAAKKVVKKKVVKKASGIVKKPKAVVKKKAGAGKAK